MTIHGAVAAALHAHSRATLTAIDPVPPALATASAASPLSDGWHRTGAGVGVGMVVLVELPQPDTVKASAMANGRVRAIESLHDAQGDPFPRCANRRVTRRT
jgi:hypothetical protein